MNVHPIICRDLKYPDEGWMRNVLNNDEVSVIDTEGIREVDVESVNVRLDKKELIETHDRVRVPEDIEVGWLVWVSKRNVQLRMKTVESEST